VKRKNRYTKIIIVLEGHALLLLDRQDGFLLEIKETKQLALPVQELPIVQEIQDTTISIVTMVLV
jgi:hypothetical protein